MLVKYLNQLNISDFTEKKQQELPRVSGKCHLFNLPQLKEIATNTHNLGIQHPEGTTQEYTNSQTCMLYSFLDE